MWIICCCFARNHTVRFFVDTRRSYPNRSMKQPTSWPTFSRNLETSAKAHSQKPAGTVILVYAYISSTLNPLLLFPFVSIFKCSFPEIYGSCCFCSWQWWWGTDFFLGFGFFFLFLALKLRTGMHYMFLFVSPKGVACNCFCFIHESWHLKWVVFFMP